jgi:hypothetical protein
MKTSPVTQILIARTRICSLLFVDKLTQKLEIILFVCSQKIEMFPEEMLTD